MIRWVGYCGCVVLFAGEKRRYGQRAFLGGEYDSYLILRP